MYLRLYNAIPEKLYTTNLLYSLLQKVIYNIASFSGMLYNIYILPNGNGRENFVPLIVIIPSLEKKETITDRTVPTNAFGEKYLIICLAEYLRILFSADNGQFWPVMVPFLQGVPNLPKSQKFYN
jgi:hypothetical protein